MSLHKSYRLQCDGWDLHHRRGLPTDKVYGECQIYSESFRVPGASTSKEARRTATAHKWLRHRESFPIFTDRPDAGSTTITFDLCPVCAGKLELQ